MKNTKTTFLLLLLIMAVSIVRAQCPMGTVFTVTNNSSSNIDESLRRALDCIDDAGSILTTIQFNINGATEIQPTAAGPLIVNKANIIIDGTNMGGGGPIIIDGGAAAGPSPNGLVLTSPNITVQNLIISNFTNSAQGNGILVNTNNPTIQNNTLIGNRLGISMPSTVTDFDITGNTIGSSGQGNTAGGISINIALGGNISDNEIAHNGGAGININNGTVLISSNSMYCNTTGITRPMPPVPPTIAPSNTQEIRGTALSGQVIEVFVHSTVGCPGMSCQGKTYIDRVTTSASNTWVLPLTGQVNAGDIVTATQTQGGNNTSAFSGCVAIADCAPFMMSISIQQDNVSCFGESDGSLTALPGGLTYEWSNGTMTATISGLSPGDYSVTVTSADGCTATKTGTITEPDVLSGNIASTNILCFGEMTGSATATAQGGTAPYFFAWSNGQSGQNTANLSAGNYTVTITDTNGCSTIEPITITEPAALNAAISPSDVLCFGGMTGFATVTAQGGIGPYSFVWNDSQQQTDDLAINLVAGNYTVTITDVNNCTITQATTINQPNALNLTINATDETAVGANNGTVTTSVIGGTGPFNYLWSNGATDPSLMGLGLGLYSVTVTDANNCTINNAATVNAFSCSGFQATISKSDVDCFSNNTGTATVMPNGGSLPYVFNWSDNQTTPTATDLAAGNYTVTITDQNGCMLVQATTIIQPTALNVTVNTTDETAANAKDGTAAALATGGTPPFTYNWNPMGNTAQITGLAPGIYTVTVTDNNGCSTIGSAMVNVFSCAGFSASISKFDVSCFNGNNGQATATVVGGMPGYTFSWSNGKTTAIIIDLTAGNYTVTISDQSGCITIQNTSIVQPDELVLMVTATDETSLESNDGSATAVANGGTPPFTYQWNNDSTNAELVNLRPGLYSITITDTNGCTTMGSTTVLAGGCLVPPVYAVYANSEICGNKTFTLSVDDEPNSPGVTYVWAFPNGDTVTTTADSIVIMATSADFSGEYFVARDSGGCRSISVGIEVEVLTVDDLFAGNDTILCGASLIALRADLLSSGTGSWLSLGAATVDDPQKNPTAARNLQPGRNIFVWQVALGDCPQAGSDTVVYFLENKPVARDDNYSIQRAYDVAVMEVLLNDALGGLSDTLLVQVTTPNVGQLELLAEDRRFRYTVGEDFRGTMTFQYAVCNPASVCDLPCDTATVTIKVHNLPTVPSGLVVEDGGPNGELTIRGVNGFTRVEITIMDRWGDLVFQERDYENDRPWLGDYKRTGKYLPGGAYYYYLKAYDGQLQVGETMTGVVHLFTK